MNIAIDVSPIKNKYHKVRGVGNYITNLIASLEKQHGDFSFATFENNQELPEHVDVIHYPYFDPFFRSYTIDAQNTVVTVHDLTPIVFKEQFPVGLKGWWQWQMNKRMLKKAKVIVTDSKASAKDIIRIVRVEEERVKTVYLAASEEFVRITNYELRIKKVKEKYNLPEQFALYVGDVTWNKNLPRIIDAAQDANVPLVLAGKAVVSTDYDASHPWNKDLVTVQEKIKKSTNVITLGFIPTDDLVALYNLATVFVMPSLYEGFGLPVLEAMQCGCPVITSQEGSLPEVAGEAAYYVDAYKTEDIRKGIEEVIKNKKLQDQLREKGLQQAKQFSWKKTAEEMVKVYREVAKES